MSSGMRVLLVASSRIEAELILGRLRSAGVSAHMSADDEGGMNLALQTGRVRILVDAEDEAEAHRILRDTEPKHEVQRAPNGFQKWLWKLLGGKIPGTE